MKKFKSLVLLLILFAGCVSTEKPIDKTEIGMFTPYAFNPEVLNGKVKMITEKNYLAKELDGKIVADRPLTLKDRDSIGWTNDFIVTYNEDGLLIQCDEIDENGKVLYSAKTSIEDKTIIKCEYYKNDTLKEIQKIQHDTTGWVVKVEGYSPQDSLKSIMDVKNDEKGNIISVIFKNSMNEISSKFESAYNENNKRTGYKFFDPQGNKTFEQKYSYNDQGFMEKQVIINKEGKESESLYTYTYEENGNWIECIGNEGKNKIIAKRTIEYYK
jgi:hypothetical protein